MKAIKLIAVVLISSAALVAVAKPFHHQGRDGGHLREQLQALNLNADQQESIDDILKNAKAEAKSVRQSQRELFKRMRELDVASLSEADINELSEAFGRNASDKFRQKLETRVAIAAVLTPEQREQMKEAREAHRKEMREKMKKHREAH